MAKRFALQYSDIVFFFFFFSEPLIRSRRFLKHLRFPPLSTNYLKKLLRTMFTSGNVQRKHVNTVHRPEEEHKEEFALFHRKCLLKANGVCDAWLLVVTQGPVLSRLYCQPVLVKMVKVKYSLQHSNKAGLAAEMEGKECFFSFFFSFFV